MSEPDEDPLAAGVGTWRGIVSRDYSLYSRQKELMLLNIAEPQKEKKKEEERILSDFNFPQPPNLGEIS